MINHNISKKKTERQEPGKTGIIQGRPTQMKIKDKLKTKFDFSKFRTSINFQDDHGELYIE
jgi:hypothetical protein